MASSTVTRTAPGRNILSPPPNLILKVSVSLDSLSHLIYLASLVITYINPTQLLPNTRLRHGSYGWTIAKLKSARSSSPLTVRTG